MLIAMERSANINQVWERIVLHVTELTKEHSNSKKTGCQLE